MYLNALTKTEINILKLLMAEPNTLFSIKKIAENIGQDYRITYEAIKKLSKKGVIVKEKHGNTNFCKLNYETDLSLLSYIEALRAEEFLKKHKEISPIIKDLLNKIFMPSFSLILFGSYATGTYKKQSDMDLMFLIPDKNLEKEVSSAIAFIERTTPIGIHEITSTYDNFAEMLKERKTNIAKEVLNNHIIFYGSEAFYKVLKTVL